MDETYPCKKQYAPPSITTEPCTFLPTIMRDPEYDSTLEIAYSTISPPKSDSAYPMQIKLNLIDQHSNYSDGDSCGSPYPMTPNTPNTPYPGSDLSKKQRHNLREQRRILRISHQFSILRHKLETAGYALPKKDKFSVLQTTLEYIHQLESQQGPTHRTSSAPPAYNSHPFTVDSMPSPVPSLSPIQSYPAHPYLSNTVTDSNSYIEASAASYKDVFLHSSMPSLVCKLDGTILEANALFLELNLKNMDELKLHTLYTMCTQNDAPTMYKLVNRVLSCEVNTAQSKMMWRYTNGGDRRVFVSISMVRDDMQRPLNLHCSILPLS